MKKKKGYKSRHSFTSTTLSECYRYAVKFMEKWKIQLMLLKTKTKQQNHLQFLIKCIYSFPKVLLWWPAVYSTSLLSLFPSSHSLSNPLQCPEITSKAVSWFCSHDPGDFALLEVFLQTKLLNYRTNLLGIRRVTGMEAVVDVAF